MNNKQLRLLDFWPLFFLLAFLEAAVALIALLRIPSDEIGISATRWVLLLPILVALAASAFASYSSRFNPEFRTHWLDPVSRPRLFQFLSLAFPALATVAVIGSFLLRWWDPSQLLPFFERAWPLLAFIIIFGIQSTLWLFLLRFGVHRTELPAGKPGLIAFVILLFAFGFVSLTRLGVTPDPAYWGEPGVPIQGWQLGLTLILGAYFLPLSMLPIVKSNPRRTEIILCILIWLITLGIWLSVPNDVLKNSFYFPIDPPTNMPLPYSDSGYYDYMAHSLLIGTDYTGEIPTRPLYIIFLTMLHLLFGENYNLIIIGQTLVLATIPVVFYTLGKRRLES